MENLICKNLCKSYKDKEVLKDVNLTLEPGKIYGLIGRNGVGKTTLLSLISAQSTVTSGEVTLGNEPVWENPNALQHICFSRELGMSVSTGTGAMKVKQYLKAAKMFYPNWDEEMAQKLIKLFELDMKKQIAKLSKGMASMITIIVALASKAPYTFLDEPVAGLDVVARDMFYRLLIEEYTESGRTFVISTHIIEEAADVFEEVIIVKNHGIFLKEHTDALLERARHISGRADVIDTVTQDMHTYHEENIGRSKGVTVLLEPGQKISSNDEITVQKVSLQNLFVALCGEEISLKNER